MTAKINIQCYKCNTVYELEPDMIGETVECAICGSVFIIPDFNPDAESDIVPTVNIPTAKPQAPVEEAPVEEAPVEEAPVEEAPVEEAPVEEAPAVVAEVPELAPVPEMEDEEVSMASSKRLSTATIKLNIGGGHGMIPLVDDQFGIKKSHNPKHQNRDENVLKNFEKAQAKSAKKTPEPEPEPEAAQKWWKLGNKKK